MDAGTLNVTWGGMTQESTALRCSLALHGIEISEALAFGLTGGIGVSYGVFELGQAAHLHLGLRLPGEGLSSAAERLGLRLSVHETTSRKAAQAALIEALGAGYAPVVQVDPAALPYYGLPAILVRWLTPVPVIVLDLDPAAESVLLADLPDQPLHLPLAELAAARATQSGIRHRLFTLDPPERELPFASAAEAAIRVGIEGMIEPPLSSFGLAALQKWAALAFDRKDPRGWPRLLAQDGLLFDVLTSATLAIEGLGRADGLRGLHADFLDEAAALLERPALRQAAAAYRESARHWRALARALLPARLPVLGISAQIITHRSMLIREQGMEALPQIQAFSAMLAQHRAAFIKSEAPRNGTREALFIAIQEAVQAVCVAEQEALIALQGAMQDRVGLWMQQAN